MVKYKIDVFAELKKRICRVGNERENASDLQKIF